MTLAVFNISKHPDGGEIDLEQAAGLLRYDEALLAHQISEYHSSSHPTPFKCSIKPRSAKAVETIQRDLQV